MYACVLETGRRFFEGYAGGTINHSILETHHPPIRVSGPTCANRNKGERG